MAPRFSIVIPLYNKENYIEATLNSVFKQTYKAFELIIVDDFSTDNSLKIVEKYKDKRLTIIKHKKNKGLSASRNTGILHSKSNYITFLDADDLWDIEFLSKIDFLISKYPSQSVFATKYHVLLKNNKTIEYDFTFKNFKNDGLLNFFEDSRNQSIYNHSCVCIKKEAFKKVGNYNEKINFGEDIDFMIRLHAEFPLVYCNSVYSTYRMDSENQITQSGLTGKVLPNYDFYESHFSNRKDIKKYLDFHRFVKAKLFKIDNDKKRYSLLIKNIDFKNLTKKQRILLQAPRWLLILVSKFKLVLRGFGINLTSY